MIALIIFWVSAAVIAYAYLGYPALLWCRACIIRKPVSKRPIEPSVSVILVIRNEESRIRTKLANICALDYPSDKLQIIVVSDASTDGSVEVVRNYRSAQLPKITLLELASHSGKAAGLREAIAASTNEILMFTDVRQEIEQSALRNLVANFADPAIGCVSGELMLRRSGGSARGDISLYWRVEKLVRKLESQTGSVIGATGALYAVRRAAVVAPPAGTVLDDVFIPMHVVKSGLRVIFESRAVAWDTTCDERQEFRRKVRTLAGNYQLIRLAPWLLTRENPVLLSFVSHKLLRMWVPLLLLGAWLANLVLIFSGELYLATFVMQCLGYFAAMWALLLPERFVPGICSAAFSVLLLNAAAVVAAFEFIVHGRELDHLWKSNEVTSTGVISGGGAR
jgi:cellulose synthase/poly-beta-1,6-N-acetylglucosamine synthase-like glycosyltransferase